MNVVVDKDEFWPYMKLTPDGGEYGIELPDYVVIRYVSAQKAFETAADVLEDALKVAGYS